MFSAKSKSYLVVVSLLLLPLLVEGCFGAIQYVPNPDLRSGVYTDTFNFSDSEIDPKKVDQLYLDVARLMGVTPDTSKPRPQVLVVSPIDIHQEYLRLRPSAKTRDGIALALYIPYADRILIPHYDRTLLIHELAHYFTFHYLSAPRAKWEAIADRVVDQEGSAR